MAIAIRVDPAMIADIRADAGNHLVLLRVEPGKPFVYFSGSAWDKGQGGFRTRQSWDAYAAGEKLDFRVPRRSEEHTSELQSLMRTSYAVFCLKKKKT